MFDLNFNGNIARLRLSRPETRNAIRVREWAELADRAEEAARSGAAVLIISGQSSGAFSSGADLSDFSGFLDDAEARSRFRRAMRSGLDRVRDLPIPTLAAIDGPCFGAAVALAMACDIRVASRAARFAITPAKLGISYPQEDIARLLTLVGTGAAARLLLSAAAIDADEAHRIGLVDILVPDELESSLGSLAEAIAANDRASLATLKRGIALAAAGVSQDDEQDRLFDALLGSDVMVERLAARGKGPS